MDREIPSNPRECKVPSQGPGWKMPFPLLLLTMCLLRAVHTLKGPRLVSGESGGAVTIQCHYTPVSVNRHQRKYWCRVGPPTGICHTIVSTNRYTHHGYLDRVTIADFPQRGLFVVRLSQLSLDDAGYYRCGIGHSNNMLFFRVNLTVSAGPASPAPTAPSAAGELFTASLGTASPAAKMWISEATPALGRQSTGWNRAAPAVGTSKTTASAKGRQTPGSTRAVAPVTGSITEGSIKTIALILESPASKLRSVFNTTRYAQAWATGSPVTNKVRVSGGGKGMTTTKVGRSGHKKGSDWIGIGAFRKTTGATRPSALAWETFQEATPVSKQQASGFTEGAISAAVMWTLGTTHVDTASVEGSADQDLGSAAGHQGSQATPSQGLAAGPQRTPGQGLSKKRTFPEDENSSWILIPISTVLAVFLLVALVLLQRRLWSKRRPQEAGRIPRVTLIQMTRFLELNLQPAQLPNVKKELPRGDHGPSQASLTSLERDLGP